MLGAKLCRRLQRLIQLPGGDEVCVVCLLRLSEDIIRLLGLSVTVGRCPHSDRDCTTARYKKSGATAVVAVALSALLLFTLVYNVVHFVLGYRANRFVAMEFVYVQTVEIIGFFVYATVLRGCESELLLKNGLIEVIASKRQPFTKHSLNKIKKTFVTYNIVCILYVIYFVHEVIFNIVEATDPWATFLKIHVMMVAWSHYFFSHVVMMHILLYNVIIDEHSYYLKNQMTNRLKYYANNELISWIDTPELRKTNRESTTSIIKSIQEFRRKYIAVVESIDGMNRYANPLLLFLFILFVFLIIISFYIASTIVIAKAKSQIFFFKAVAVRTAVLCFFMVINLKAIENVYDAPDNMINFLAAYPITRLTKEEQLQAGLLMDQLQMIKPEVSVSGIKTVRMSMSSEITGTIISYVLVALQFQTPTVGNVLPQLSTTTDTIV